MMMILYQESLMDFTSETINKLIQEGYQDTLSK